MATPHSSPLCGPPGLLLLLIGVITSHLPEVQAAPIDFWCNPPYRRGMANMTEELKDDVAGCVGSDTLSSPVQLPKVGLSMAEWENKTSDLIGACYVFPVHISNSELVVLLPVQRQQQSVGVSFPDFLKQQLKMQIQQKRSEVIRSLEMFQDGVRGARNQTTVECQTRVLEQLRTRIANYLLIVKRLQLQNDTGTLSHSAVQSSSQTSLNNVLDKFGLLLKGKLEYLAIDLKDSVCKVEHGTT